jgi:hypothetical protein
MKRDKDWFLMTKERKVNYEKMAWVPLFVDEQTELGDFPDPGFDDDYFGISTMLLDADEAVELLQLDWIDVRPSLHRPGFDSDGFHSAKYYFGHVHGEYLVFPIEPEGKSSPRLVLIEPDLILGLRLHPVGHDWASARNEGEVVIHQKLDGGGNVTKVEIRAEYLKDFLAAREMGLAIITLRERKHIFSTPPEFTLPKSKPKPTWQWEGGINEIDEHGEHFGNTWTVTILGRYDVDADEDAPVAEYIPDDKKLRRRDFETKFGESKRYCVASDLIMRDWIAPALASPRVRGDKPTESCVFVADAASSRMSAQELKDEPRWRWLTFKPESISNLLDQGKVQLEWWSRQTACFRYGDGLSVPFGINTKGLINIFSKDVIELAPHRQRHFAGHSVSPEGGACEELVRAQMQNDPADTIAAESRIMYVRTKIDEAFVRRYKKALFRPHDMVTGIAARTHRFAASNVEELYDLAKDLRRIFIEPIDDDFLKSLTQSCPDDLGSIKRLCKLLDDAGQVGRSITAPLAGIHELRQASAHLPRKSVDEAFSLVGVAPDAPSIISAMNMIESVVDSIDSIANGLEAQP